MKKILLILLIIGLITGLFVGCIPSVPSTPSEVEGEEEEIEPTTFRVVLVELFNTQGCPACIQMNPIVEEVAQEYDKSQVILIEEATWGLYSTPETSERYSWYLPESKERKTPNILFNGLKKRMHPGGSGGGGGGNQGNSGDTGTGEADTTKPVITGSRAPLPNSFGWNNTNVTVSFSCADTGPIQSGIETNTVTGAIVTTEGKDQSVTNTGVCIDVAGNTADPVTVSNINIDKTPPVVTITLPGTGEYVLNQSITATWSATDALSGVVSPVSGTVSIDTSSVGTKTFTLPAGTATDKAGNSSLKVTKSYSVIADTEEPIIVDPEDPDTVYPQKWATGTGTVENPWANDCINTALTNVPAGGTIFLRAGYYTLSTQLFTETKSFNLIGEGMGKSIIVLDITAGFGIYLENNRFTLKGFTIDGDSQNGLKPQGVIGITDCDYAVMEDIEVMNGGYYGISLYEVNHSSFQNIYAHDNYRHGLHTGSQITGRNMYNTYRDFYAWDNGVNGFDDWSADDYPIEQCYNIYDNIQCWDNGSTGIAIGGQKGGILSNSFASGNGTSGIYLYDIEDFNIHDCSATLNGDEGIWIERADNVNFTNVIVKNNNVSDAAFSGIKVGENSNEIKFTSCQSYDDRDTPLQRYGLQLTGTNTDISLLNCKLTPNSLGEIYNPAGVVLTVITEKWEFLLLSLCGSETTEAISICNLQLASAKKALYVLQGESPCWVRSSQPPIPSVASKWVTIMTV